MPKIGSKFWQQMCQKKRFHKVFAKRKSFHGTKDHSFTLGRIKIFWIKQYQGFNASISNEYFSNYFM